MKKSVFYLIAYFALFNAFQSIQAQEFKYKNIPLAYFNSGVDSNLVSYDIPLNSTTHFISKEPISYMDISTENLEGDLPEKNLARIKPLKEKMKEGDQFIVSIVTPVAVNVFKLRCVNEKFTGSAAHVIKIHEMDGVPIQNEEYFKKEDFLSFATEALEMKRRIFNLSTTAYDLTLNVSNIFSVHGHVLLKVQLKNHSKIPFDIDEVRFKIKDRKILNTTVSQDLEIKPVYVLKEDNNSSVPVSRENVYAFKKFTYPQDKVFSVEFTEKQISGRKISIDIGYNQILQADVLKSDH